MRKEIYHVFFVDGTSCEEWALSAEQAKIVAQADRIKKGQNYEVEIVKCVDPLEKDYV
jgi:hypothetical protein